MPGPWGGDRVCEGDEEPAGGQLRCDSQRAMGLGEGGLCRPEEMKRVLFFFFPPTHCFPGRSVATGLGCHGPHPRDSWVPGAALDEGGAEGWWWQSCQPGGQPGLTGGVQEAGDNKHLIKSVK